MPISSHSHRDAHTALFFLTGCKSLSDLFTETAMFLSIDDNNTSTVKYKPPSNSSSTYSNSSVPEPTKSEYRRASGPTHRTRTLRNKETQTEDLTAVGAQFWSDGDNDYGYPTELGVEETGANSTSEAICQVVTKANVMANMITGGKDDFISGTMRSTMDSVARTVKWIRRTAKISHTQPISAHQWLRAFGLHCKDPELDEVWHYETGEIAPVMSKEALQEVWASFPRDEEQNSEEERNENENDAEAPASKKRKRESGSFDKDLLMFCPSRKLASQEGEAMIDLLRRHIQEHPERFVAECSGAVMVLLAALTHKEECVTNLGLNKFSALSGDQVVNLVQGIAAHNAKLSTGKPNPLETLELSLIGAVTPKHVARILDVTGGIKELIIWDNLGVGWKEVARVADGCIAKFITRANFLELWKS
ncbi:hypothetical protein F4803DRAFT_550602 [Xylaria telfairii]|nr:hypothetical protein F4803DRAFT_550602 [Xylaria telfairii]